MILRISYKNAQQRSHCLPELMGEDSRGEEGRGGIGERVLDTEGEQG